MEEVVKSKMFSALGILLFLANFIFTFTATYWGINLLATICLGMSLPFMVRNLAGVEEKDVVGR